MASEAVVQEYEAYLLALSPQEKTRLGQDIVSFLGGTPGPLGRDGGIDGWIQLNGEGLGAVYYQVKLSKKPVGVPDLKKFRQSVEDRQKHGRCLALVISVKGITHDARKYVEDHASEFSVCVLTFRDILQSRHRVTLERAGFPEARFLAERLSRAVRAEKRG